jgi:glycerol-1-phosphate dehydrogenase [NAD(P)+]
MSISEFAAQDGFPVEYGHGLFDGLGDRLGATVVVMQPNPWELIKERFGTPPRLVIEARELSPAALDDLAASIPGNVTIVGVGGGSAMDVAKWLRWKTQLPLIQVPTLASVDACFTRMSAIRNDNKVSYQGDAVPERVLVDYRILQEAPSRFISAGIGDVLSCHTAYADWEMASKLGKSIPWNAAAAQASLRYMDVLESVAPEIAKQSTVGIKTLMELYRENGWLSHEVGHARFEEGSEHFFAYTFENVTGRTILHGELVTMGVLMIAALTGNDYQRVKSIVQRARTLHKPEDVGITSREIEETLYAMKEFSIAQDYWYSWAHVLEIGKAEVAEALKALDF